MSNTEQSRVEFESWVQSEYCTPLSQTKRKRMFEAWQARDNEIADLRDEVERFRKFQADALHLFTLEAMGYGLSIENAKDMAQERIDVILSK